MTKQELDELIEKLDSMSYVYHDMTFWHILGMRDVLKALRKDPNTAKTMNLKEQKSKQIDDNVVDKQQKKNKKK